VENITTESPGYLNETTKMPSIYFIGKSIPVVRLGRFLAILIPGVYIVVQERLRSPSKDLLLIVREQLFAVLYMDSWPEDSWLTR